MCHTGVLEGGGWKTEELGAVLAAKKLGEDDLCGRALHDGVWSALKRALAGSVCRLWQ